MPAEPRGSGAPLGAQPDPLVQTCLLRGLEMGPLAQTQTLRDYEQVRPLGPRMAPPEPSRHCRVLAGSMAGALATAAGCGAQEGRRGRW